MVYELSLVDGVPTVVNPTEDNSKNLPIVIENKYQTSQGYSGNFYDINTSLRGGILYRSFCILVYLKLNFQTQILKEKC